MDDNPVVKFESVRLQKQALALKTEISNQLLEHFGEPAKVAVNLLANFVRDVVTVEVLQHVWGEDVGTLEIETPRNWWEMLKRDHAPAWFLRRFPVSVTVQVYHARTLYPQVSFPDWKHSTILVHKHDRPGYMTTEAQHEQRDTSAAEGIMTTNVVLIGNSDDKLTQAEWVRFYRRVDTAVKTLSSVVHFSGTAHPVDYWQNAAWVFEIDAAHVPLLHAQLARACMLYRQDSIAWTTGETVFVSAVDDEAAQ